MKLLQNIKNLLTNNNAYANIRESLNKQRKTKMKVNKKQVSKKANKVFNWFIIGGVSMVVLGFSARGVMNYTTGMTEEQRIIASVFVVSLCAYVIYTNLKNVVK